MPIQTIGSTGERAKFDIVARDRQGRLECIKDTGDPDRYDQWADVYRADWFPRESGTLTDWRIIGNQDQNISSLRNLVYVVPVVISLAAICANCIIRIANFSSVHAAAAMWKGNLFLVTVLIGLLVHCTNADVKSRVGFNWYFFFFFFFFANNNFLCFWFGFWINERVYFDNLLKVDGDLVGKSGADLLIKGDPWKMLTLLERLMVANSGKLHDGQRAGHKSVANKNKTSKRNAELIHSILGIPRMMKMMGKK